MSILHSILTDLADESQQLDGWVEHLDEAQWRLDTPAAGWTIAHQIGHLAWTDDASLTAIDDPEAFGQMMKAAVADPTGFVDAGAEQWAALEPQRLLQRWRDGRGELADALACVPEGQKISWFGPPMSAASMATARMMETWTHARDIAAALQIEPPRDHRARHIAYLGVRTRDFSYQMRGEDPPANQFRVELTGPDGEEWSWGPQDANQRVTGDGYDFALLATRRLHRDDAEVHANGPDARYWLGIIQAFAGPPGNEPPRKSELPQKNEAQ